MRPWRGASWRAWPATACTEAGRQPPRPPRPSAPHRRMCSLFCVPSLQPATEAPLLRLRLASGPHCCRCCSPLYPSLRHRVLLIVAIPSTHPHPPGTPIRMRNQTLFDSRTPHTGACMQRCHLPLALPACPTVPGPLYPSLSPIRHPPNPLRPPALPTVLPPLILLASPIGPPK